MATGLPDFPLFQAEPRHTAATRWQVWLSRFDNLLVAMAIEDNTRKRAMLKHYIGEEFHMLLGTLPDSGKVDEYDKAKTALTNYFIPKKNTEYEIFFYFRQSKQEPGESFDAFYSRLRRLSVNCEFTNCDAEIKSQIIQKCLSDKVRNDGLGKKLSLDELLTLGRTTEAVQMQSKAMTSNENSKPGESSAVHKVKLKWNPKNKKFGNAKDTAEKQSSKTCYNCGGSWPHSQGKCPAYKKTCNKCGGQNHFARMCGQSRKKPNKARYQQGRHKQRSTVNQVEQDSLSESDTEFNGMFNITTVGTDNTPDDPYVVPISINGQEIIMEIDTGCRHTLVNEETSKQICKGNTLHKSRKKLTTFLGEEIPVKGEIGVSVCYNNKSQDLQLTVVEGKGPNLLGRNWLRVLGIDWSTVNKLEVNEVQTDEKLKLKEDFLDQYKELFKDELGTFSGPKVKIYIDQNAEPQFFKARSVPFAYKTLVEKELDRLIQDGILTPVPFSDWAAPVVPV